VGIYVDQLQMDMVHVFLDSVLNSYGRNGIYMFRIFDNVHLLFGKVCVHVMKAYVGVNV